VIIAILFYDRIPTMTDNSYIVGWHYGCSGHKQTFGRLYNPTTKPCEIDYRCVNLYLIRRAIAVIIGSPQIRRGSYLDSIKVKRLDRITTGEEIGNRVNVVYPAWIDFTKYNNRASELTCLALYLYLAALADNAIEHFRALHVADSQRVPLTG